MNEPLKLKIPFLIVTPAFVGDADQQAALRPQSFKGLLRHWHRAIDPHIVKRDAKGCAGSGRDDEIWGGTDKGHGQSRVLLRITSRRDPQTWSWDRQKFNAHTSGHGRNAVNGAWYLGYPFGLKGNSHRNALAPNTLFTLEGMIPDGDRLGMEKIQAILASFWLLAMLGSCGTRGRRGFGSLQAQGWSLENDDNSPLWRSLFARLPSPGRANTPENWRQELNQGMRVLRDWFADEHFSTQALHPHIDLTRKFSPVLLPGVSDWQGALARAGEKMQRFRRRKQPDYRWAKEAMEKPDRRDHQAPRRVSFGLPLTFRFSSLKGHQLTYYPTRIHKDDPRPPERFASPLYIKIIRLGLRYHAMFFLLAGLQPGQEQNLRSWHVKREKYGKVEFTKSNYYPPVDQSALNEFLTQIRQENVA